MLFASPLELNQSRCRTTRKKGVWSVSLWLTFWDTHPYSLFPKRPVLPLDQILMTDILQAPKTLRIAPIKDVGGSLMRG